MANRNYPVSRVFSNHMMPVSLDAKVSIGSSGAPTLASARYGVASISRSAAGKYTITLADSFPGGIQMIRVLMQSKDASTPSGINTVELVTETVATDGKINIVCLAPTDASTTTPVATDPISGSKMIIQILVNNSSTQ